MELTVLYPTLGLFMSFLKDREWAVRLCRAYHTLMHEEFIKRSPRLQAVALLPVQDPKAAALELRRAVSELGHVGGMLAADGNHLLGDERFLPIFEEADRLGVMLGIHASGSHLGGAGVDLFPRFIQAHTCSHAFGQMRQLTSIVLEGICERFPRLRLAFLEAGCGWAPYWVERIEEHFELAPSIGVGIKDILGIFLTAGITFYIYRQTETQRGEIRKEGSRIDLTPKEFELTVALFRNIGRLMSRGHLQEAVWGRSGDLATRTVDTHVSQVRKKLDLRAESGYRVVPIYNYGYRLEKTSPPS